MKKILSIIFVSFLLSGNGYANTPVENFVFKKLFDEYSYCTVYYKFLARSVERIELRNDDKLFAEEMNKLSEKSEINMIFFAKKISKPANDVQKNIQRIYESFLNIAGRDYSKTEILINQYTNSCENSLADPEVRMVYWSKRFQENKEKELNEMFLPSEKPKELKGVNLYCKDRAKILTDGYAGIHFSTSRKAEFYKIRNFKVVKEILIYKPEVEKIIFLKNNKEYFVLFRDSLQWGSMKCEVMTFDAEDVTNFALEKMIITQKSKNKL